MHALINFQPGNSSSRFGSQSWKRALVGIGSGIDFSQEFIGQSPILAMFFLILNSIVHILARTQLYKLHVKSSGKYWAIHFDMVIYKQRKYILCVKRIIVKML